MGSQTNGPKPTNNVTVSRSSTPKNVDPQTGKSTIAGSNEAAPENIVHQRSFAQPSPVTPPKVVAPKAHASEQDQKEALEKNSMLNKEREDV